MIYQKSPLALGYVNIFMKRLTKPWLKAFSGLSINISAGWFAILLIGPSVAFPDTGPEILALIRSIVNGIIYLLITVVLEQELEK